MGPLNGRPKATADVCRLIVALVQTFPHQTLSLCLQRRINLMFTFSERHVTVCHYNDKRLRDHLSL